MCLKLHRYFLAHLYCVQYRAENGLLQDVTYDPSFITDQSLFKQIA